jgi:hypothetical protein
MDVTEVTAVRLGDINSLATFAPGLTVQERTDIQDVLLDAQLFASHLHDFEQQWMSWMHYYRHCLSTRGLKLKSLVLDDSLVVSSTEDLMQATFRITGSTGREQLGELVRRSFKATGVYDAADAYFKRGGDQARLGSFQVVPCVRSRGDEILLLLCGLHLNADEYSAGGRRLLFYFKGGAYVFDSAVYAPYRADVTRYLKSKTNAFITDVNIQY